jgi:hypothetical protein
MQTNEDVFARRILRLACIPEIEVHVTIQRPQLDGQDYTCRYSISWPGKVQIGHAMGVDQLQALLLAVSHISSDLTSSPFYKAGQLYWLEPDDGCGLKLFNAS